MYVAMHICGMAEFFLRLPVENVSKICLIFFMQERDLKLHLFPAPTY